MLDMLDVKNECAIEYHLNTKDVPKCSVVK